METKWVGEIAENCPEVRLVLVALKCDLRKRDDEDEDSQPEKPMIQYDEGLKVAERIKALRYLGTSSSFRAELPRRSQLRDFSPGWELLANGSRDQLVHAYPIYAPT